MCPQINHGSWDWVEHDIIQSVLHFCMNTTNTHSHTVNYTTTGNEEKRGNEWSRSVEEFHCHDYAC